VNVIGRAANEHGRYGPAIADGMGMEKQRHADRRGEMVTTQYSPGSRSTGALAHGGVLACAPRHAAIEAEKFGGKTQ